MNKIFLQINCSPEDEFFSSKRIAIVTDELNQWGGGELVLQEILKIFPKADLFTPFISSEIESRLVDKNYFSGKITQTFLKNKFIRALDKFLMTIYPFACETFDLRGYEIVLSVTSRFAKNIILPENAVHVCYIHSPPRFLWSDWKRYLEEIKGVKKFFVPLAPLFLPKIREIDYLSSRRVDLFIGNSKYIKARVEKYYKHENVDFLYPSIDSSKFLFSDKKENFYLAGGRHVSYKKFDLIINAFNQLELPLKIYGVGEETEILKRMNRSRNTEFIGKISDEERNKLFANAKAFIFPQIEDFGIVPLEAQVSGTPVVAFRKGGSLETVVENKTGIFFDDQSSVSLADAIRRFEKIEKWDYEKIREHALKFDTKFFVNGLKSKIFHFIKFKKFSL
ncbi:MAG: glycosyltransferase family 4 protein [Patescibacteria group bacterium]